MPRGIFVTGTDTNVGKTVVAAALMHRYRPHISAGYWKPIQTGIEQDDDTAVVRELGSCSDSEIFTEGYRLRRPLSPHLAAQLSGMHIRLAEIERHYSALSRLRCWFVEGAGGVLVPINEHETMLDVIARVAMPVLVVARASLGTINHTLLTISALRSRSLTVAGVVMVGERNNSNREAIEAFGGTAVVGEMPYFANPTPQTIHDWACTELDADNSLSCLLT